MPRKEKQHAASDENSESSLCRCAHAADNYVSEPNDGRTKSSGQPANQQDDRQETRLRARANRVIRGIEAELKGEFRSEDGRKRLEGELDNINLRIGTGISFCLATSNGTIPLAAVKIGTHNDGQKNAQFELDTENGDQVPDVVAGNKLEARNGTNAGMADCSKPLLISATFQRDR